MLQQDNLQHFLRAEPLFPAKSLQIKKTYVLLCVFSDSKCISFNCCCSSVVEHFLGKEEVVSSSLINSSEKSNNDWSATVRWHLFLMTILDACIQSIAIKNKYRFRRLQSLIDFLSATRQDERSEVKSDQQTQVKTSATRSGITKTSLLSLF